MKRLITTILLLLIYSTAFSQDAQIERHLQGIESHVDSVRAILATPELPPDPAPEPEPPAAPYTFWNGLWDSWNYSGDGFNTIKVPSPGKADDVLSEEKNVFVSISHTLRKDGKIATAAEKERWKTILRGRANQMKNLDPNRTIIMLQDEPLGYSGYTLDEVQFMVDWAREYWGEEVQIGFSFVRNSIRKKELPKGIDFALMPMYLFFRKDYPDIQIWSKQEFDNYFDEQIKIARKKLPGVDLYVIGQGFYNTDSAPDRRRKWRQPPLEAPAWYAEAVERNKVKGIIWWVHSINRNDTVALEDMPEYFQEILKLN